MKISSILIIFAINLLSTKITIAEDVLLPHVDGLKRIGTSTGLAEHHIRNHLSQHFESALADSNDSVESYDSTEIVDATKSPMRRESQDRGGSRERRNCSQDCKICYDPAKVKIAYQCYNTVGVDGFNMCVEYCKRNWGGF